MNHAAELRPSFVRTEFLWHRLIAAALMLLALPAFAQTAVTVQPPNLTGPVAGSLAGKAAVSAGASTYSVSIAVPPGTAGVTPAVSLSYSSQAGMSYLGRGWTLSGQSSITRCGKTVVPDGVRTAVTLTATDQFCLDGQRLLLVSGTHGAAAEYRTRIETFSKIVSTGSNPAKGPDSWTVYTKSGTVITYGGTADSTIEAQGKTQVLRWALSRSQDRRGNYFSMAYAEDNASGEYYPTRIRYTGNDTTGLVPYNAINFIYEVRPDKWQGYVAGSLLSRTRRLTALQTRIDTAADGSGGTLVRDYRVAYRMNPVNGRSLVDTLRDCDGAGNCLPATSFAWTVRDPAANTLNGPGSGDWGGPAVGLQPVSLTNGSKEQQVQSLVRMGDFDGDGAMDLAQAYGNDTNWQVCLSRRTTFSCQTWAGPKILSRKAVVGDFNGDGRMDVAAPPEIGSTNWNVCLSTGSGFSCSTWTAPSAGVNSSMVGDFNGDGRDDLLIYDRNGSKGGSKLCLSTGSGFGTCTPYDTTDFATATQTDFETGPNIQRITGDFNGDGRTDFIVSQKTGNFSDASVFLAGDQGLVPTPSMGVTNFFLPVMPYPGTTQLGDHNQDPYDSYSDIFESHNLNSVYTSQVCHSTGTQILCSPVQNNSGGIIQLSDMFDYDGDGRGDALSYGNKVCQVGDSAPYLVGDAFGGSANVICTPWAFTPAGTVTATFFGDFNGDGATDRAYYSETTGTWRIALTGNGGTSDLLASVTDGEGLQTQFSYKTMDDASVYTRGADVPYPARNLVNGSPLVSQQRVSNGQGGWLSTDFRYKGLRNHLQGLGSLGFESVSSVDQVTQTTSVSSFRQDDPFIGQPAQIKSTQANGVVLSQTDMSYASFATTGGAVHPYAATSTTATRDLDNSAMTTATMRVDPSGIDAFGNITASTQVLSGGGDSFTTTTVNTYDNLAPNWLIGLRRNQCLERKGVRRARAIAQSLSSSLREPARRLDFL